MRVILRTNTTESGVSDWVDPPLQGAILETFPVEQKISKANLAKFFRGHVCWHENITEEAVMALWENRGTNHRDEGDFVIRQVGEDTLWTLEIRDLDHLEQLLKECNGQLEFSQPFNKVGLFEIDFLPWCGG